MDWTDENGGLDERHSLLTTLFDRMPMGIAVFDRDYRLKRCNPTWAAFIERYGPPSAQPAEPGTPYADLAPGAEEVAFPLFERALQGETIRQEGLRLQTGDKVSYWDVVLAPLETDGRITGILNVTIDVTERVKAEREVMRHRDRLEEEVARRTAELRRANEALQREQSFSSAVLETAGALVVVVGRDGRIIRFNQAAEDITGWASEEVENRFFWNLFLVEGEVAAVRDVFRHLTEGQFPNHHENTWLTKSGDRRLINWSNTALVDDKGAVEYVIATGIDVTDRRRAESELRRRHDRLERQVDQRTAELQQRVAFENLVSTISADFINRAPEEIDEGIREALEAVGTFMGVDRSYVFRYSDDGQRMENTHEWCAEGIQPQIRSMQDVSVQALEWSNDLLMRGEVLHIPSVDDLPEEAEAERLAFRGQGNRSMVAVPMRYQGETIGLVGFDAVREQRSWSDESIQLLELLAAILVNALERKRADEALQESERMLSTLISNLPGMAYRARNDHDWTMEFVSEGSLELTGYRPDELVGSERMAYGALIHPEDRAKVWERVQAALDAHHPFEITYRIRTREGERWVWERGQGVYTRQGRLEALEGFITDITERVAARRHLEQRVEERTHELSTLLEVSQTVASTLELEPLLGLILDQLKSVMDYDAASVMVLEEDVLRLLAYRGPIPHEEALKIAFDLDEAGVNRTVVEGEELVLIPDVRGDTELAQAFRATAGDELETTFGYIRSWMGVPLVVKENLVGMLALDHSEPGYYTRERAEMATAFASHAAAAMENARLYETEQERLEESERRRRVAEGLRDVLAVLNTERSLEKVLDTILEQACRLLRSEAGVVYELLLEEGLVDIEVTCRMPDGFEAIGPLPLIQSEANLATLRRECYTVPDIQAGLSDPPPMDEADRVRARPWAEIVSGSFRSYLSVPIVVEDKVYGAMSLFYATCRDFTFEERDLAMMLADQAALAIENARLRVEAEKSAAAAERSRLARDLHDAVTQTLFSASLIADVLPRIWEKDIDQGLGRLQELRELTRGALAEMRTLLLELRPAALTDAELSELLHQLAESITGRARVPVDVAIDGACDLPVDVKVALYRIAQESLNNVAKHSGATQATVMLHCRDEVTLDIVDDGRGFDPTGIPPDSLGVGIMRERAEGIGADLRIMSELGEGTRVHVGWSG